MTVTETSTRSYSTREAAAMAGVSYRMLDYWLRNGTIKPSGTVLPGSGHYRRFTAEDVDALCRVVADWRIAESVVQDFRSGTLWDQLHDRR